MRTRHFVAEALRGLVLAGALGAAALHAPSAAACAGVGRHGFVTQTGEEALIVWDAAARQQHFIRTAAFPGMTEDFGFLVPTPTRPELGEVDQDVFQRLFALYQAPLPRAKNGHGVKSAPQTVEVLERRVVAGLDAAVLRAEDPAALQGWLAKHGYPASDTLRAWLAPYVEKKWIVTAFRVAPQAPGQAAGQGEVQMKAVRMSFQTDAPFFPYSEPQREGATPRPFRVSVVATERMQVKGSGWGGDVGYAGQPGEALSKLVADVAPKAAVGAWLTVFDEPASVRGREDLTFERAAEQEPVRSSLRTRLTP